jgi:hypothetical protein
MHASLAFFVELIGPCLIGRIERKKEVFGLHGWMEHYWNLMMGKVVWGNGIGMELHWERGMMME